MASDKTFYPGRLLLGLSECLVAVGGIAYVLAMTGALGIDISHYQILEDGDLKHLPVPNMLSTVVASIGSLYVGAHGVRNVGKALNY